MLHERLRVHCSADDAGCVFLPRGSSLGLARIIDYLSGQVQGFH